MRVEKQAAVEYIPEEDDHFDDRLSARMIPKAEIISSKRNGKKCPILLYILALILLLTGAIIATLWMLGLPDIINEHGKRIDDIEIQVQVNTDDIHELNKGEQRSEFKSVCALPKETGPCRMSLQRWYFDLIEGKCKQFTYGGCRGNENNFVTQPDCAKACNEGQEHGKSIEDLKVPGLEPVEEENPCMIEPSAGPCEEKLERYYYDFNDHTCKKFLYGGCAGNTNKFLTEAQCRDRCATIPMKEQNLCSLPSEVGMCRAAMPRWYYNMKEGKCLEFIYGGCSGNDNNFSTEEKCLERCGGSSSQEDDDHKHVARSMNSICSLPYDVGPCRARMARYFYDSITKRCAQFYYGGCEGNQNNFESLQQCEQFCS